MHLSRVFIENFRGISRLELELGRDTVVIGENNHGKTSLLDVLERCLGGGPEGEAPAWEYRDFRRGPRGVVGPIRVVLDFEPTPEDPTGPLTRRLLAAAMTAGPDGAQRLRVQFTGVPDSGSVVAAFLDGEDRLLDVPAAQAVVERLRRLHPVLVVRLGQAPPPEGLEWVSKSDLRDFDPTDGDDAEDAITQVYRRLLRTRGAIPTREVRRGLQAARHLGAGQPGAEGPAGRSLLGRMVERLLGDEAAAGPASGVGSGSRSLGVLMVVGALLEARGTGAMDPEATPLIAIEEPEVHLHPMLLASAWHAIQGLQAQTLVTTNSGELLSEVPLPCLRRLVRRRERIEAYRLREHTLSGDALRRVAYHVRAKRGVTLFARCWLLVEGETEFWLLQELARVLGYELGSEGVRCVEFAQCGVDPLVRLADDLGIRWHLLSDGDESGITFAAEAARRIPGTRRRDHVTRLERSNVEMLLWHEGFEEVYRKAAGLPATPEAGEGQPAPRKVVARAVRAHSKPYLALLVAEEAGRRGPGSVPPALRHVIEASVRLARSAVENGG